MTAALSRVFQWYSPDFGGKLDGHGRPHDRYLRYLALSISRMPATVIIVLAA